MQPSLLSLSTAGAHTLAAATAVAAPSLHFELAAASSSLPPDARSDAKTALTV
jgi:hypothetical protein